MSIASDALTFFRTEWADRLVDSCVVKEETGTSFNSGTGVYTPTYTTRYTGACLVRPASESDASYGQRLVVVFSHVVSIPWNQNTVTVNDLVDVTSTFDGKLNGKQFIVRGIPTDTYTTHRILLCQDNQGA